MHDSKRKSSASDTEDTPFGPMTEFVSEEPPFHPGEATTEFVSEAAPPNAKRSCLVIEVFAGSCRLSKACRRIGLRTAAVDKDPARSENFPIYQCDLTNASEFALLMQYIEAEKENCYTCILHQAVAQHRGLVKKPLDLLHCAPMRIQMDCLT